MQNFVYFDHNATTPIDPDVARHVPEWLAAWGNPSSIHFAGRGPKALVREARRSIADYLGVDPLELIFTSGGSEANNLAIKGIAAPTTDARDHVIVSAIEHPSVLKTAEALSSRGFTVDVVPVDRSGAFDFGYFERVLSARTRLVSVMLVNNETGHVLPVKEIAARAHARGALVHCDAVQALGKLPINLKSLGVDLATISGHKFYALKGCGVLYQRRGLTLQPLVDGGAQERHRRAGTENVLSIASLGYMCGTKGLRVVEEAERVGRLRDHLEARALGEIGGVRLTGADGLRVTNTSNMTIEGVDGETLLMNLDVRGFAVSTGAACSSGSPEPSPVLLNMGLSRAEAQRSLRVSLGWGTTGAQVDSFVDELKSVVTRVRGFEQREKR